MPVNLDDVIIKIGNDEYKCVVGLVHTKDDLGRPKLITLIHEEQVVHLNGGEEFVTLFGSPAVWHRKK